MQRLYSTPHTKKRIGGNAPDALMFSVILAEALGNLAFEAALVPAIHEVGVERVDRAGR